MLQIFDYLPVVSYAGVAVAGAAAREFGSFALRKLGVSIIRENGNGHSNGDATKKSTSFWSGEIYSKAGEAMDNELQKSVVPILAAQTEILKRLADSNESIKENTVKLVTIAELRR